MDHIKDLLAEVNDQYMVLSEIADHNEKLMQELMEPAPGPRCTFPDAHRISRVSRSGSPYHVITQ